MNCRWRNYANHVLWPRLIASPRWLRSNDDLRHELYARWRQAVKADW